MFKPDSAKAVGRSAASTLSTQVQWQHPTVVQAGIDQTWLAIADGVSDWQADIPFSFTVIGDTDAGDLDSALGDNFAAMFAQQMMPEMAKSRFLLHMGDVTYPLGTYQNYLSGFLHPYYALLTALPARVDYGCKSHASKRSPAVVFDWPVLPVPGNHDYARLPFWSNCRQRLLRFVCDRLHRLTGIDWGHYGGQGGEAYGQTFLDDLSQLSPSQLKQHLMRHYDSLLDPSERDTSDQPDSTKPAYCLTYRPGQFTRLPNRYYRYHYGGIDFFALDSNTWKGSAEAPGFDRAQLDWLEKELVNSWRSARSIGRVIYLHHSPYTTETRRWQQSETLLVRRHLRGVLDRVKATLNAELEDGFLSDSPLVDLVISGHAHCLEHLKTEQTGHGDAHIDWLVCGGSGTSLRRQRSSGRDILEEMTVEGLPLAQVVARSQTYVGVHGHGEKTQHFHSFVTIDVQPDAQSLLTVRPFVVVKGHSGWQTKGLAEIRVGRRRPLKHRSLPPQRVLRPVGLPQGFKQSSRPAAS